MKFGSLFAGIGGMDLGLERAGMECRWQVEIDEFCRKVLMKHWPEVPKYGDIKELTGEELGRVDLICGGFPCQDISPAGRGAGIHGERSGLWKEFARILGAVRPRFALVENSPALRGRGLAVVLQDLWALGFDAEWHCIPACALGAHHIRDRIFIVAYADVLRCRSATKPSAGGGREATSTRRSGRIPEKEHGESPERLDLLAYTPGPRCSEGQPKTSGPVRVEARRQEPQRRGGGACVLADADFEGLQIRQEQDRLRELATAQRSTPAAPDGEPLVRAAIARGERHAWTVEPGVVRMVHGVPDRVERIRGLGNAVVPQVAEWIGRQIVGMNAEAP